MAEQGRSDASSNIPSIIPIDAPPAYEPKPLDDGEETQSEGPERKPRLWKQILLSLGLALLSFWLTILLIYAFSRRPTTVYSKVYSPEFRFRPAASPIITETLADGRTLIRGAQPAD